jgi:predicted Zn-dependent protease
MIKQLSLAVLLYSAIGFTQSLDSFTGLKSGGSIPEDFTKLTSEKFRQDLEANTDETLDEDFFLSTRFFIDELLLSGRILFNDPLSDYLNKVAKYTLRTEKGIYKELRFYVLKSNIVNAFSTDQGIIVFTTGLLAQLENEAQLAYIISHEVSHYTEHHVRKSYAEKQSFRKGEGKYRRLSYATKISELSVYEKDNELEADRKGIDIYLKSEYSIDEIFSSFEMLLYSYLPFDDVSFDTTYFNTDILNIPGSLFSDTINEITREEDYDDHNSTHPNIKKRIDEGFDYLDEKKSRGDLRFKISEEEFYHIRNLARFETVNENLANRDYAKAVYLIYLLQKEFPDNRFLDLSLVKALYGLSKYKNANRFSEVTHTLRKVEGESYVLHDFLKSLKKDQLAVIAFRKIYDTSLKYPDDKLFQRYLEDMKKELASKSKLEIDDLKQKPLSEEISDFQELVQDFDIEDSIRKVEESDLSKYEKIRLKKKLRAIGEKVDPEDENNLAQDFHLYGLYDILGENETFIDELKELKALYDEENETSDYWYDDVSYYDPVGANKVVVIDPVFEKYNLRYKRNHTKSEDKKLDLGNMFLADYSKIDMETELISSKELTKIDVDKYNEIGLVFQWIEEVLAHDNLDMISSKNDAMKDLIDKFGTNHFLFTSIYAYKERNQFNSNHLLGILAFYSIPFVIADLLIVHNYFELAAVSINADTDKVEFLSVTDVNLKESNRIIQAYVYDILYQLNATK